MSNLGYEDTPFISGNPYRVHGSERPEPPVVKPGAGGGPPSDAIVLFDGTDLSKWTNYADGGEAGWKLENGYMEVVPKSGDIATKEEIGDAQFHLEWAAPEELTGDSQGRGNSGVFLMSRYEIQVLDNYQNPTYADGACGGIYGQCPPLVNACLPPGQWQTYDIVWIAPRFAGDKLVSPAYVTVFQNNILIHNKKELIGPTRHKVTTCYESHPPAAPLRLQDHKDKVRYRNIWYRSLADYDAQSGCSCGCGC